LGNLRDHYLGRNALEGLEWIILTITWDMITFNPIRRSEKFLERGPAVKAGRLMYEIHLWFGLPGDSLPN
jgi:hypothetical protein